tara:strand:+ start:578 stop:760 length:183 start_codon:yes stop_codon:yes gene_type:complete
MEQKIMSDIKIIKEDIFIIKNELKVIIDLIKLREIREDFVVVNKNKMSQSKLYINRGWLL